MIQYLELAQRILSEGRWIKIGDTHRLTIYGAQMRFDLSAGFPMLTTKRVWWRGIVEELLWFLRGSTDVRELQAVGVHIWDANAKPDGTIGDSYGHQWRNWNHEGYDQITRAIELLEKRPKSTRNVVMAWNPHQIDRMALPPCHFSFQTLSDGKNLTLCATMRSVDFCVGLPFNIASYALLTHLLAARTGLQPESLIMQLSHVHVYEQHVENLKLQMQREPKPLPTLIINGEISGDLRALKAEQFTLKDYRHHPGVSYEMIAT